MAIGVDAILAAIAVAYLGEVVGVWPQIEREFRQVRGITEHSPAWLAWGLGLLGAGILIAAWRGSPSRGRRRCPRCWYDMTGIGLTCPECGATAASAMRLYRARRRRVIVALGALILASAYGTWLVPRVKRGGWQATIPPTVLIIGMEWLPEDSITNRVIRSRGENWSLTFRMSVGRLFTWQRAWAITRARSLVLAEGDPRVVSAAVGLAETWPQDPALSNACFRCLAREVGSADPARRLPAARCVWRASMHDPVSLPAEEIARLTPGLIRALDDDSDDVFYGACGLLRLAGARADAAAPRLFQLAGVCNQRRRHQAHFALYAMAPESRAVRDGALAALAADDAEMRRTAIMVLGRTPRGDAEVTARLLEVLRGPDHEESRRAALALHRQAPASVAIPALFEQFRSDRPKREEYLDRLTPTTRDPEYARELETWIPELVAILRSSVALERGAAWMVLSHCDPLRIDLSAALPDIERLQNDPSPDVAPQARYLAPRIRARQARMAELAAQGP